jgi:DNA polymerase/3'-5' exonuclease PolX
MDLLTACTLAKELLQDIKAGCEKITIAGSIRRKKPRVKDIEIVVIPTINTYDEKNLFGEVIETKETDVLEELLNALLGTRKWQWKKDDKIKRWGPRYKKLRHKKLDISCDIFYAKVGSWGGALTIRTGPAEFSKGIAMYTQSLGYHLADGYLLHKHPKPEGGCGAGSRCKQIVAISTEELFFSHLGLEFIEPEFRTKETLDEAIRKGKPYFGKADS